MKKKNRCTALQYAHRVRVHSQTVGALDFLEELQWKKKKLRTRFMSAYASGNSSALTYEPSLEVREGEFLSVSRFQLHCASAPISR